MSVDRTQLPTRLSQLLLDTLKPQKASQATKTLLELRKSEGYLFALLQSLIKGTYIDQFSFPLIIQLKNYLKQHFITENQLLKIKENLIFLFSAHGSEKSHNILREIVSTLTYKYFDTWIDIEEINNIILKPVPTNNFVGFAWAISALVGIPQSCTYYFCSEEGNKPKLCLFDKLLQGMTEKMLQCQMIELYFVISYLHEYAYMSNSKDLNSFLTIHFLRIIGCGINLWMIREQDFPSETHAYMLKAKQQYAKLLDEIMSKEQMYKKNENKAYGLDLWRHQQFQALLLKFIFSLKGEETQTQLRCLKVLNYFIRILKPKNFYPHVQKFLYVTIPQLLYQFRNVVLFDTLEIRTKQMNFIPVRIKENLVALWGNLSCLNLKENFEVAQRNMKISQLRKGDRKVSTSLSTYNLHMKFLFQKISQVHFFFTPFQMERNLDQKSLWQGDEWIIVAFDIFKQAKDKLSLPQNYEISQSVPQILISYVLPKLFHPNHVIRKHVISVITTYHESFADLLLTEEFKSNFVKLLEQIEDEESTLYILLVLPDLIWNLNIYHIVQSRVQIILPRFTKFLKQKQDHELAKSFSQFIKTFQNQIEDPQPILIDFIAHFFTIYNNPKTNTLIYTDCIHSMFLINMKQEKILKELFELVEFTLKQSDQQAIGIEIVQYDMLQVISTYIAKKESLTKEDMVIFQIYCYYLSSGGSPCPQINPQLSENRINLSWIEKINQFQIPQDCFLNMVWVLHAFSLKSEMFWHNKTTKNRPIYDYLKALSVCIERSNTNIEYKQEQFLDIIHVILYGIIFILDDLSLQEINTGLNDILTDIWILVIEKIYKIHKKAIFQVIFDKNKMEKPGMIEDWYMFRMRNEVIQIKKRLVQILSTFLFLFPGQSGTFFTQSDRLIEQYLCMVSFYSPSDNEDKDYIKRTILGISYLLQNFELQKVIAKQCLKLLNKLISQTIEQSSQTGGIFKMNKKSTYDQDSFFDEDERLPVSIQFNIPKFKENYILQEIDQISESLQSIRDYLDKDTKKDKEELKLINSILEKGSLFLAQLGISL